MTQNAKQQYQSKRNPAAGGTPRFFAFRSAFFASNGFTLLEMTIAIGIFSLIAVAAIGITLAAVQAQRKAANLQVVQDNARFGLELMTKELRTGSAYRLTTFCGISGEEVSFLTFTGAVRVYYKSGNSLMRLVGATKCASAISFIGGDAIVTLAQFRVW